MCWVFDVCVEMGCQALEPDMVTYSALISACGKGQELRRALNVCAEMWRQALEPDMVTYSALISACGEGQKLHGAFDV